jgi:outer membrane lipoprotein-sorting protein
VRTISCLTIALASLGCAGAQSPAVASIPIDSFPPLAVGTTTIDSVDAGDAAPSAPDAVDLARRVEAMYARATPFECDVREDSTDFYGRKLGRRGTISFERPGRLRADLGTSVLVVDGSKATVAHTQGPSSYVFAYAVGPEHCPALVAFAAGEGMIARRLELSVAPGAAMNAPGFVVLVGQPVPPSAMMARVLFYVDEATLEVRRAVFVGSGTTRTRYDYEPLKKNVTLAPSLFTVAPPPGALLTISLAPPPLVPLLSALP